jgi:cyclase
MLKTRVIPCLLYRDGALVKGERFDSWRRVGAALPAVKVFNLRDVDELILLDIDATKHGRGPDFEEIAHLASECFVPLTVGGGVSSVEDVRRLLQVGADKVAINEACYSRPDLVTQIANRFGSQCVVCAIDARRMPDGSYECHGGNGMQPRGMAPDEWARELAGRGAGEILLTSVERDGTLTGYDIDLIRMVCNAVNIPVIAAGGAGSYSHMLEAIHDGGASAVAAGAMFQFTQQTPALARKHLQEHGVAVRHSTQRHG